MNPTFPSFNHLSGVLRRVAETHGGCRPPVKDRGRDYSVPL